MEQNIAAMARQTRLGRIWPGRVTALLAVTLLSGAAAGPLRADMFTPGEKQQIKLGDQAAQQIERQYHVINDDRARRLEEVGRRLVDALPPKERGPWDYRFHLIDSKEVNAFALPGGNIFFFTGLYDRLRTEDQLAAVVGHEMTHVRKEHWAHMVAAEQKRQFFLTGLLAITHAGQGWQTAAGLVDSMVNLRYSRKDEDQADAGGLQDMVDAGYNPQGMLGLFHILQQAGGGGGGPAFLQDHPLTTTRIQHTQERIDELGTSNFPSERPLE
jgi:predicted Zn-dependent protease